MSIAERKPREDARCPKPFYRVSESVSGHLKGRIAFLSEHFLVRGIYSLYEGENISASVLKFLHEINREEVASRSRV